MDTPWGYSQHEYVITQGVYEIDTAGHGGILVSPEAALKLLSPAARAKGWRWGNWYAYEEDCDWAIFAFEQPELFAAHLNRVYQGKRAWTAEEVKQMADRVICQFHRDYLDRREQKQAS